MCGLVRNGMPCQVGWLYYFLVGVCSGILAGVIDIGAAWMSDLTVSLGCTMIEKHVAG